MPSATLRNVHQLPANSAAPPTRRPVRTRNTKLARNLAVWVANRNISPNSISQAGLGFAVYSAIAFFFAPDAEGLIRYICFGSAVFFCLARLFCNLMDGMVAIELGKADDNGEFWNEVPDRASDILILVGIGYGIGSADLGWIAAAFSVMTAYVRQVGGSRNYCGPMAKAHRMIAVAAAGTACLFIDDSAIGNTVILVTLWVVAAGTFVTLIRRCACLLNEGRAEAPPAPAANVAA